MSGPALAQAGRPLDATQARLLDRVTWGVDDASARAIAAQGTEAWLRAQLHPPAADRLPPAVQAQIDAMKYTKVPIIDIYREFAALHQAASALKDRDLQRAALQLPNQMAADAMHEAMARSLLRDIYSPDQLKEQMTWFWFNHFNVQVFKGNVALMVGDYEDHALRPHVLGRFRDLLEATMRHPAMLRYLDNADNAVGHINENYAREIMELHTMGVGSGYSQRDVQELARILTGVGVDANPKPPPLPLLPRSPLIRDGLFEFNPARHDYGDKVFLGHRIKGRGFAEVEEALDLLARDPATARHISRQLAVYFVADDPPPALIDDMARTFQRTDGDIAEVMETMFRSPQFAASLGTKFKDPAHFVLSAMRLAWGEQVILDTHQIQSWIGGMGEGLFTKETPDGYSMVSDAWDGPGQMDLRFEVARQMGSGPAGLFKPPTPPTGSAPTAAMAAAPAGQAMPQPGVPDIRRAALADGLLALAPETTRAVLARATAPRDWNALFFSSPQFMRR